MIARRAWSVGLLALAFAAGAAWLASRGDGEARSGAPSPSGASSSHEHAGEAPEPLEGAPDPAAAVAPAAAADLEAPEPLEGSAAPEREPLDPVRTKLYFAHQMESTHRAVMFAARHHSFDPLVTARIAELLEEEARAIRELLASDATPRALFGLIEAERSATDAAVETLLTGYQLLMFEMAHAGVGDDYAHALLEMQQ